MQFWRRVIFAGLVAVFMQGLCLIDFAQASTTAGRQSLVNAELPNAPELQTPAGQTQKNPGTPNRDANKSVPTSRQQPKRILGIVPNYRAMSAGAIPPPPTPAGAFREATENSFDYSSFVFEKYGYAVVRDAATNVFREFSPDTVAHVRSLHS